MVIRQTIFFDRKLQIEYIVYCSYCENVFSFNKEHRCIGSWDKSLNRNCPICEGKLNHFLPEWDMLVNGLQ